jgi:hypothetical protein
LVAGEEAEPDSLIIGLNRVFLDAEQREIRGGSDRLNAGGGVDADDQDANDLERAVTSAGHLDAGASHISDVGESTGGGVVFLGVDRVDGGLSISSEQGDEALHLGLGVAYEAGAYLVIRR